MASIAQGPYSSWRPQATATLGATTGSRRERHVEIHHPTGIDPRDAQVKLTLFDHHGKLYKTGLLDGGYLRTFQGILKDVQSFYGKMGSRPSTVDALDKTGFNQRVVAQALKQLNHYQHRLQHPPRDS